MPATPQPLVGALGPVWTPILQAAHAQKQRTASLAAQQQQQGSYDQYGNLVALIGSNLQQTVPIGATWIETAHSEKVPTGLTAAVYVATGSNVGAVGIQNGQAGMIVPKNLSTGTLTVTAGSTSATLASTISGAFAVDQMIGAYVLNADGTTTQALTPGTYITSLSPFTLSLAATQSGTAIYCAAANFSIVT